MATKDVPYLAITRPLTWDELDAVTPIRLDQHVFDVGQTGSGKSTMLKLKVLSLERDLRRHGVPESNYKIIVIDTKDTPHNVPWSQGNFHFKNAARITRWTDFVPTRIKERIVIYRPEPGSEFSRPESFQQFFGYLREIKLQHRGERLQESGLLPMRIFIDELKDVVGEANNRNVYLESLSELLTQGRSTWQTMFIATQNPIYLDSDIRRQMQVKFAYYLDAPADRDLMAKQMGVPAIREPIPDVHGFWFANRQVEQLRGRAMYIAGVIRHGV